MNLKILLLTSSQLMEVEGMSGKQEKCKIEWLRENINFDFLGEIKWDFNIPFFEFNRSTPQWTPQHCFMCWYSFIHSADSRWSKELIACSEFLLFITRTIPRGERKHSWILFHIIKNISFRLLCLLYSSILSHTWWTSNDGSTQFDISSKQPNLNSLPFISHLSLASIFFMNNSS